MQKYKPYRKNFDYTYSFGIFPTIELLARVPEQVSVVFLTPDSEHSMGIQKIRQLCEQHDIPIEVNAKAISAVTRNENSYAVGVFNKYSSELVADKPHVLLVNPDDAGNLGTVIRTMVGFEHTNLAIIRPAVDVFDPKVVRASMGAVFSANVAYYNSLKDYQEKFTHQLYPFILGTPTLLHDITFTAPYTLVFGNEGSGLPQEYGKIGTPVRIEQGNSIDSLNVGIAAGIALYSAYLQQK
jgi:TrmH family RNA methyltransferase